MLEVIVKRGDVKAEEAQPGETKVFFKAGVLAALEELRDQYMSKMIVKFQCLCLWYLAELNTGRRRKQLLVRCAANWEFAWNLETRDQFG